MERSVEMEARTLEEATSNALRTLDANREDVEIKVLDDGKTGFLGFGSRRAKIRVTIKKAGETAAATVVEDADEGLKNEGSPAEAPVVLVESPRKESREEVEVDPEMARELLSGLIDHMNMEGEIESGIHDGRMNMNVVGKDSGILIGKGGQTLEAIQYLINLMYSKKTKSRAGFIVDVEAYKIRREKKLQTIAIEARNKVVKNKKPFSTSALSSQDRRIIHIALQNDKEVKTVSRGDGVLKKVIILPK